MSRGETVVSVGAPQYFSPLPPLQPNIQPPLTSLAFRNERDLGQEWSPQRELGTECRGEPALGRLGYAWALAQL